MGSVNVDAISFNLQQDYTFLNPMPPPKRAGSDDPEEGIPKKKRFESYFGEFGWCMEPQLDDWATPAEREAERAKWAEGFE